MINDFFYTLAAQAANLETMVVNLVKTVVN